MAADWPFFSVNPVLFAAQRLARLFKSLDFYFRLLSVTADRLDLAGSRVLQRSGERLVASNSGLVALRSASALLCVENPFYPIASYI